MNNIIDLCKDKIPLPVTNGLLWIWLTNPYLFSFNNYTETHAKNFLPCIIYELLEDYELETNGYSKGYKTKDLAIEALKNALEKYEC